MAFEELLIGITFHATMTLSNSISNTDFPVKLGDHDSRQKGSEGSVLPKDKRT